MPSHVCPICKRTYTYPSIKDWPHFPFCSRRCKMVDLNNWLGGRYTVPGAEEEDRSEEQEEEERNR